MLAWIIHAGVIDDRASPVARNGIPKEFKVQRSRLNVDEIACLFEL
jgi:hypothetical protein